MQPRIPRRTFIAAIAGLPAVTSLLLACGDGTETTDANLTRSTAARQPGSDPEIAAEAINKFSNALYDAMSAENPDANLVYSPVSIALALAMTLTGAAGTTRTEMANVLHTGGDGDSDLDIYHSSMNALSTHLSSLSPGEADGDGTLNIANSLWGQSGEHWQPAFLDLLAQQYGAGLENLDFRNDPDGARDMINEWVNEATNDRIPQLLSDGTITNLTRLVLVNAIYLKATWRTTFEDHLTRQEPFTTSTGTETEVAMMHLADFIGYATGEGWQAVELPYVFGGLSLVAAVTDDPSVPSPSLRDVVAGLDIGSVDLSFPKFDFETKTSLVDTLSSLGMATAFTDDADFSAMAPNPDLRISDVVHQANITTDEDGTEAAAATAVVMAESAAPLPDDPIAITFDRPFQFWLRDQTTDVVIFAGRVADPSQTR